MYFSEMKSSLPMDEYTTCHSAFLRTKDRYGSSHFAIAREGQLTLLRSEVPRSDWPA